MEVNPLSIILVKSDSKGDRLLFRYPYHDQHYDRRHAAAGGRPNRRRNPYAIGCPEDILQSPPPQTSNVDDGQLCGFTDEVLSTLFAVKPELCNRKFELKVNDVRFVAHPTLMQSNQHGIGNINNAAGAASTVGQQTTKEPTDGMSGAAANGVMSTTASTATVSSAVSGTGTTQTPSTAVGDASATNPNNSSATINSQPQPTSTTSSAATAQPTSSNAPAASTASSILINIVFALHAQASYSIVKCYYELSKRLGHALVYEEKRVGYLSDEMRLMVKTHDEIAGVMTHSDDHPTGGQTSGLGEMGVGGGGVGGGSGVGGSHAKAPGAFDLILERSTLAQCLKNIYHDLCTTGLLNTTINQWVTLSFCLPQKAHQFHKRGVVVEPEAIDRCLQSLKPYHGMLLLVDLTELLDCFPPSGARMLLQLLNAYNPLKTLQNMAAEADLAIKHVYELVGHLVYWAKATIIYPLCETNVYVIAPDAPLHSHSPLVDKFSTKFPGMSLFEVISDFSLPTSIGHLTTPLQHPTRQGTLAQMVLWMLQHHLLMQLHTYVQFMPTEHGECCSSASDVGEGGGQQQRPNGGFLDDESEDGIRVDEERIGGMEPAGDYDDDDDGNALSQLTISSQPMAVPNTSRRSITDDPTTLSDDPDDDDNTDAAPVATHLHQHHHHESNFDLPLHSPASSTDATTENEAESLAGSVEDEDKIKDLLLAFQEPERSAVRDLSAASNAEDLALMVKLWQAGYFKGEHHLEEIMYFENLRRSQLLQLLDKFRDVLIIYETEDPAIATLYTQTVD